MTFAEWRAKYSGVQVQQPYLEAQDVYMITDRLIPGGPLQDLQKLTDYRVTGDMLKAHYGPTVWLAPRVDRDDWTRTDYMCHRVDHQTYYYSLARLIGLATLERYVLAIAPIERLRREFGQDPHMNTIALAKWDGMHTGVRSLISEQNKSKRIMDRSWCGQPLQSGTICWSLSESVCVLKAVARGMIERESKVQS